MLGVTLEFFSKDLFVPELLSLFLLCDKRRCEMSLSRSQTRHLTYLDKLVQSLLIRSVQHHSRAGASAAL